MNEAFRDHVTSTAFVLHLGKTQIAAIVRLDLELAAEISLDYRAVRQSPVASLHRCDVTAIKGLEARGLVEYVWPLHEHKYKGPDGIRINSPEYLNHPRSEVHRLTRAGELVCQLLRECGLYQDYAGPLLPLVEAQKARKAA